jgi:hypothetical protein
MEEFSRRVDNNLIELAERSGDGIGVRLYWRQGTDEVVLEVIDDKTGVSFGVQVPGNQALEAFHHPFLYVPAPEPLFELATL